MLSKKDVDFNENTEKSKELFEKTLLPEIRRLLNNDRYTFSLNENHGIVVYDIQQGVQFDLEEFLR